MNELDDILIMSFTYRNYEFLYKKYLKIKNIIEENGILKTEENVVKCYVLTTSLLGCTYREGLFISIFNNEEFWSNKRLLKGIFSSDIGIDNKDTMINIRSYTDLIVQRLIFNIVSDYVEEKFHKVDKCVYSGRKYKEPMDCFEEIQNYIENDYKIIEIEFEDCSNINFMEKQIEYFFSGNPKIINFFKKYVEIYYDKENIKQYTGLFNLLIRNVLLYKLDLFISGMVNKSKGKDLKYIRVNNKLIIMGIDFRGNILSQIKKYISDEYHEMSYIKRNKYNNKCKIVTIEGYKVNKSSIGIQNNNKFKEIFRLKSNTLDKDIEEINKNIINLVGDINNITKCKYCGGIHLDKSFMSNYIKISNIKKLENIDKIIVQDFYRKYKKTYVTNKQLFGVFSLADIFSAYKNKFETLGDSICKCSIDKEIFEMNEKELEILNENKKLYFINEIMNDSKNDLVTMILKRIIPSREESFEIGFNEELIEITEHKDILNQYRSGQLNEGDYCYFDLQSMINANRDSRIIELRIQNEILRKKIRSYYLEKEDLKVSEVSKINTVYSYYIYTGCGNCSFIVVKNEDSVKIIMIDCGAKFIKNDVFKRNMDKCIDFIKVKFKITNFKIDDVLITHLHDDHINGFDKYFFLEDDKKLYFKDARFWINLHYSWDTDVVKSLFDFINDGKKKYNISVVNPICSNSNGCIHILYPSKNIVKTEKDTKRIVNSMEAPSNHINNSSVVYKIPIDDKSMIYPGDLETEGWDIVDCAEEKMNTNYYCVSHHGSLTGHIRNKCAMGNTISNICDCMDKCMKNTINIFMTKDGTYNKKIISENVKSDFALRLISRTDEAEGIFFLELDWKTGIVKPFEDLREVAVTNK